MLVEIKDLPSGKVYKKGMSLVPYRENIYWLGSSYEWTFSDDKPSGKFRKNANDWLNNNLKLPYTIHEHFASIRPATLERRPFIGFHPIHPQYRYFKWIGNQGLFNGSLFRQTVS